MILPECGVLRSYVSNKFIYRTKATMATKVCIVAGLGNGGKFLNFEISLL